MGRGYTWPVLDSQVVSLKTRRSFPFGFQEALLWESFLEDLLRANCPPPVTKCVALVEANTDPMHPQSAKNASECTQVRALLSQVRAPECT